MKKLVIAGVAATIGLAGVGTAAYATTTGANNNNNQSTTRTERPQLTEEQKVAKRAEREQKVKDEIAQLVKDGKLTQDQADKLLAKRAELQKEREANKPTTKPTELTEEQKAAKKAEREKKQTELKNWLKEQGIDESYIKYLSGRGGKGGHLSTRTP